MPECFLEEDWHEISTHPDSVGADSDRTDRVLLQYLHLVTGDDEDQTLRNQRKVYADVIGPQNPLEEAMAEWLSDFIEDVRTKLAEYQRAGFDEIILTPMTRTPDGLDRQLQSYWDHLLSSFQ